MEIEITFRIIIVLVLYWYLITSRYVFFSLLHRLEQLEALLKSGGKESEDARDSNQEEGNSGEGDLVDRLAAEINHLNFLVSHCEGAALLSIFKPVRYFSFSFFYD